MLQQRWQGALGAGACNGRLPLVDDGQRRVALALGVQALQRRLELLVPAHRKIRLNAAATGPNTSLLQRTHTPQNAPHHAFLPHECKSLVHPLQARNINKRDNSADCP